MTKISTCPNCSQRVTLPSGLAESRLVRCPLCDGQFPLCEVMPQAEDAPPELLPVGDPDPTAAVEPKPETESAEDDAAAAEGPREQAEPDPQAPVAPGAGLRLWEKVSEAPKIDLGSSAPSAGQAGDGHFDFGGVTVGEDPEDSSRPVAGGRRRPKKQKSLGREIVGIVLGGFGGVLLAYYGLNLFGGKKFDFADVYLPGIRHTVEHRPAWWPGWLSFEGDPTEAEADPEAGSREVDRAEIPSEPLAFGSTPFDLPPPTAKEGQKRPKPPRDAASRQAPGATRKKAAVPAGFVSLAAPPTFTPGELGEALKAAHDAFGCPRCNSKGEITEGGKTLVCPDCQGHPPDAVTPAAYPKFCRLAEVITFVEPAPGGQLAARKSAAADLLRAVGSKAENVVEIGRLASSLLERDDRQTSGIFLSGTVLATQEQEELSSAVVKIAGVEKRVAVTTGGPLGLAEGDRILVVGSLLADPPDQPIEREGADAVVWLGLCEKFQQ